MIPRMLSHDGSQNGSPFPADPPPAIPPREHQRAPRRPWPPRQPTARRHTIQMLMAAGFGVVLMFGLLMLAVRYAESDWHKKNMQARSHHGTTATPTAAATKATAACWKYTLPPAAVPHTLERLGGDAILPNHWLVLGRGLSNKTDPKLTLRALWLAMSVSGESVGMNNDFGVAYLEQKRIGEAVTQFQAALQLHPGFPPTLFNLALCAIAQRNPAEASQWLGRYLGQRPTDETALRLQATLLVQTGRADEALLLLEKFLRDQPPTQPLYLEAAQIAARLRQNAKALRYLEVALNGNPIQAVVRTYQSALFRDIRLSGDGDDLAARLAKSARIAYSTPVSEDTVLPIRVTPDALLR